MRRCISNCFLEYFLQPFTNNASRCQLSDLLRNLLSVDGRFSNVLHCISQCIGVVNRHDETAAFQAQVLGDNLCAHHRNTRTHGLQKDKRLSLTATGKNQCIGNA